MVWFHGGVRDLKPGDLLLPPSETGCSTLLKYAEKHSESTQRADRVYLTNDPKFAGLFASVYPYGDVYEAEPVGEWWTDSDALVPGIAIECERARVVAVVKRRVSPKPRPRKKA